MNAMRTEVQPRVTLRAETAADLMTPNPVSFSERTGIAEAMDLLARKGFHAAPVIDAAGHPVGVLSGTDILIHVGQQGKRAGKTDADMTVARDMMTPAVFSIGLHAPATRVVSDMTALGVHQLYVVDEAGVLVGVISALDVVRNLAS